MVNLRPFFSYYGMKFRSGRTYPEPIYPDLYEVCAGGAGYATHYPSRNVVLVDTNPIICGVWRYLIGVSELELLRLPLLGTEESVDDLGDVPQEARWLVGFWLGKALASPRRTPAPWMKSGKWPGCFWGDGVRARLAAQLRHIRHWRVIEASYSAVWTDPGLPGCEVLPRREATWFVDPPYEGKGHHYRGGLPDFGHLGEWCTRRWGQVIVCENEGATWLPFRLHGVHKTLNRKDGQQGYSREVIWTAGTVPCYMMLDL